MSIFCVKLSYGSFPIVERIIPKHQLVAITVHTGFFFLFSENGLKVSRVN